MITIPTHILILKDVYAPGKMVLAVLAETPNTTSSTVTLRAARLMD